MRGALLALGMVLYASVLPLGPLWAQGILFRSAVYPYTLRLPPGWSHQVIRVRFQTPADYFYPPVSDKVATSLAISAQTTPHGVELDRLVVANMAAMRSLGGHNVRVVKWRMVVLKRHLPVVQGDFGSGANAWSLRQVSFVGHGYRWLITISWDHRLQRLLSRLEAVAETFRYR
jgi:hypothetical protein